MTEGVGEANKFTFLDEYIFPKRPIEEQCFLQFTDNKLSAIYLINDENVHHLKQSGAVLVGTPGEEIQIFNRLFLLQNDYDFHKEIKIGSRDLTRWEDLSKYAMPITDIVFVDSYILADVSLIPSNFIKYLEVLCQSSRCSVNVVAYVNNKNVSIDPEALRQLVIVALKNITGQTPTFTLVQYTDQNGVDTLGEHDRTIFTNYIRIKSGDTYNYFYSTGIQKTKGRAGPTDPVTTPRERHTDERTTHCPRDPPRHCREVRHDARRHRPRRAKRPRPADRRRQGRTVQRSRDAGGP